jgi:excisionase family DNA binding protein
MTEMNDTVKTHGDHMDGKDATLTVDEAHRIIGREKISRGGFYAAISRHEVPHLRLGHRILIPRHAFVKWLESAGQTAAEVAESGRCGASR